MKEAKDNSHGDNLEKDDKDVRLGKGEKDECEEGGDAAVKDGGTAGTRFTNCFKILIRFVIIFC